MSVTIRISVAADPQPETKLVNLLTNTYLVSYRCVHSVLSRSARAIHRLWDNYHRPLVEFLEQRVVMPSSAFTFIITVLLAFTEIKSQSQPGFPFQTHPLLIRFSINSVVMFGLCCFAEIVASVQKHRALKTITRTTWVIESFIDAIADA